MNPAPIQPLPRGQEVLGVRARIFQVRSRRDQFYRFGNEPRTRPQTLGRAEKLPYIAPWNHK